MLTFLVTRSGFSLYPRLFFLPVCLLEDTGQNVTFLSSLPQKLGSVVFTIVFHDSVLYTLGLFIH